MAELGSEVNSACVPIAPPLPAAPPLPTSPANYPMSSCSVPPWLPTSPLTGATPAPPPIVPPPLVPSGPVLLRTAEKCSNTTADVSPESCEEAVRLCQALMKRFVKKGFLFKLLRF